MSNEYKDWLRDTATDILLDRELIKHIEYCESMYHGYIAIGIDYNWQRHMFFIWNDENEGWYYREVFI